MKNTGQLLKEKRESSNLSLSEIALATKINPKILLAIEKGDESALPAKTFLKGFVRSYALYLKMDVDAVLRTFVEETGGTPVEKVHEAYKQDSGTAGPRRRVAEENSSGMRTAAVVVIVLLIGLILGVRELIEKYQREKIVENTPAIKAIPLVQPPAAVVEENKPAPPLEAKAAAVAPVPEVVAPPPSPAPVVPPPVPSVAAKPPAAAEVPASPPPAVVSTPRPPASTEAAEIAPAGKPVVAEKPARGNSKAKNEIILEALDKVDVKFQLRGESKSLTLGPTQVHTIRADQPITLELSDGGAVNIIVNGRELGPAGELGQPKQLKVP